MTLFLNYSLPKGSPKLPNCLRLSGCRILRSHGNIIYAILRRGETLRLPNYLRFSGGMAPQIPWHYSFFGFSPARSSQVVGLLKVKYLVCWLLGSSAPQVVWLLKVKYLVCWLLGSSAPCLISLTSCRGNNSVRTGSSSTRLALPLPQHFTSVRRSHPFQQSLNLQYEQYVQYMCGYAMYNSKLLYNIGLLVRPIFALTLHGLLLIYDMYDSKLLLFIGLHDLCNVNSFRV